MKNTKNFDFNFEQNINGKIESGKCVIKYPKKIFCEYAKSDDKILVSDGKYLVVKTRSSYYQYPLKKTPLNLILDKKILIEKIYQLNNRTIDGNLINARILLGLTYYNGGNWDQALEIYKNIRIFHEV